MDELPNIHVIGFRVEYRRVAGQADLVPREWVKYAPRHAPALINEEMVSTLIPPENGIDRDDEGLKMGYMNAVWKQIEPAYRAWKEGTEVPLDGVPLGAWAGVSPAQADVFKQHKIFTVEDVRDMTEAQITRIALPGLRSLKTQAGSYLEGRDKTEQAGRLAAIEEQNAALRAQLEEMAELIASRDDDAEIAPKRRGRPRKEAVETEEAA